MEAREEKLEQKEKEVELKDKALDLRKKAFSQLLAFKDEVIGEARKTNLKLRKNGQTTRAKHQEEVNALETEKSRLGSIVISLQNSVSGFLDSDFWCPLPDPCPFIKKRKLDHLRGYETTRYHSGCEMQMLPPASASPPRRK